MKVLIFNTLYYPIKIGGAEVSVQDLAKRLKKMDIEIGIVTLGEKSEKIYVDGIPVWRLKIKNVFWPFGDYNHSRISKFVWHLVDVYNPRYSREIKAIYRDFRPDVVHTNNLSGFSVFVWGSAKRKNVKTVHTLRDYYLQCPKTTKYKNGKVCEQLCKQCKALSLIKKRKSDLVDCVVGISHFILEDHLRQGYFGNAMNKVHPRPKIQSIGNPLKDIVSTRMSLRKYRGILRFF